MNTPTLPDHVSDRLPRSRWHSPNSARDYDAAAPAIHPHYDTIHAEVIAQLPFAKDDAFHAIDLGGGSGRLAERLLSAFPRARVTIVDPSKAFLAIAEQRLTQDSDRVRLIGCRGQDPIWLTKAEPAEAIISTLAWHRLDSHEKRSAFQLVQQALRPEGIFINGDEFRPASDNAYYQLLEAWNEHMTSQLATGTIPNSFSTVLNNWRTRNLEQFGTERLSGDDHHETIEEQSAKLYGAGFANVEVTWHNALWSVLKATL